MEIKNEKILLTEGLKELNLEHNEHIINQFIKYLNELKRWNRAYNLTSIKKDEDIIIKHFLDSLLYLKAIPAGRWEICDIGSGAGFPAIPMSIVRPDLIISPIEPSRKKTAFLRHIRSMLSLINVEIIESRVEEVRDRLFDIGVSRALFDIMDVIKRASHILKKGGFFVLNKGPKIREELQSFQGNIKVEIIKAPLPFTKIERNIVIIRL